MFADRLGRNSSSFFMEDGWTDDGVVAGDKSLPWHRYGVIVVLFAEVLCRVVQHPTKHRPP